MIITKEWLIDQYWNQGKFKREIAEEINKTIGTVQYYMNKFGIKSRTKSESKKGEKNYNWKGGRRMKSSYIYILKPEHPFCGKDGYIAEHRLIMEEKLVRYLTKEEKIHHINGIKNDNRIENLILCKNTSEHGIISKSLFKCVKDLMEFGVLVFDNDKKVYEVNQNSF